MGSRDFQRLFECQPHFHIKLGALEPRALWPGISIDLGKRFDLKVIVGDIL